MRFAFVNNNRAEIIKECLEDEANQTAHLFQCVVDVSDYTYGPEVGWIYENGVFKADLENVTPRQIRQALILSGVSMETIEEALNSLPEPTRSLALVEWEYSVAFIRSNPLVNNVGLVLGWNTKQIDDLWKMAAKL